MNGEQLTSDDFLQIRVNENCSPYLEAQTPFLKVSEANMQKHFGDTGSEVFCVEQLCPLLKEFVKVKIGKESCKWHFVESNNQINQPDEFAKHAVAEVIKIAKIKG